MGRLASSPKQEEVVSWRKRVGEVRSELFNKPCKKQSVRLLSSHVVKEMEEEVFRGFLFLVHIAVAVEGAGGTARNYLPNRNLLTNYLKNSTRGHS